MDDPQISLRPEPPPLRIHHLMACAAVAAIMFTLWRAIYTQANALSTLNSVMMVFGGGLASIGITFAIFSIYWQSRGYAALTQPGQWLLIGFVVSTVCSFLAMAMFALLGAKAIRDYGLGFGLLTNAAPFVFYLWCVWKAADTWAWRLAFIVFAMMPFVSGSLLQFLAFSLGARPQSIGMMSTLVNGIGKSIALLTAVASDRYRDMSRYWTHWLGVGLSLLSLFSYILSVVVFLLNS